MNQEWTTTFFNELYWNLFMKREDAHIKQEAELIKKIAEPDNFHSFLDVCCGVGDIAAYFSQQNITVTGIEYAPDYIKNSYIDNIIQADARQRLPVPEHDLVTNWFSSFFYFNEEDNKKILQNCYEYTKKTFILECYNPYHVLLNFKPQMEYFKQFNGTNYHITRESTLHTITRTLNQKWTFNADNYFKEHYTSSHFYFPDEIYKIMKDIGFKQVEIFGIDNFNITMLNPNTPRMAFKALK